MTASVAQNLFNLIEDTHLNQEGLSLLTQLVQAGLVGMKDPVEVGSSKKKSSLSRALLSLAEPSKYSPNFYQAEAAAQLLALDPNFFQQCNTEHGQLWLEHNLFLWSKAESGKSIPGHTRNGISSLDQWALVAFSGLTDKQKSSDSLWVSCLKLNLPETAQMLLAHRPQGWQELDQKGKPLIASCAAAWAWDKALAAGLDPYVLTPKGQPFWRTILPGSSSTSPDKGSMREAVELWVRQELKNPDAAPELMDYVRKNALARIDVSSGANAWHKLNHKGQVDFVSRLPSEWISWERDYLPIWIMMAEHNQGSLSGWMDTISKHPSWLKRINQDPLAQLALDIFQAHPKLPDRLSPSLDVGAALADPRKDDVFQAVSRITKSNPAVLATFMEALHLQAETPTAQSSNRRGPRL